MNIYRVGEPSDLVDIVMEKHVKEISVEVLGCFNKYIGDSEGRDLSIERYKKELIVANSDDEELRFPIDYIMSANVVTSEEELLEISIDPTYIVKMLKPEVIKELEHCEVFKKTQEVWHQLRKMREEVGD